jgi:hypothetical protein
VIPSPSLIAILLDRNALNSSTAILYLSLFPVPTHPDNRQFPSPRAGPQNPRKIALKLYP